MSSDSEASYVTCDSFVNALFEDSFGPYEDGPIMYDNVCSCGSKYIHNLPSGEERYCLNCEKSGPAITKIYPLDDSSDYPIGPNDGPVDMNELIKSCRVQNFIEINNLTYKVNTCANVHGNHRGETPLHIACKKGNVEAVREILRKKIHDINQKDFAGWTPLHEAAESGCVEVVRCLLKAGALPSVPGFEYVTPLHKAVAKQNVDLVSALMEYGSNPHAQDDEGKTPGRYTNDPDILALLAQERKQRCAEVFVPSQHRVFVTKNVPQEVKNKMSNRSSFAFNFTKAITHVVADEKDLTTMEVLITVVKGGFVFTNEWVDKYIHMYFHLKIELEFVPKTHPCFVRSLGNRLGNLPPLFHGLKFHLMAHATPVTIHGTSFTTDDLTNIVNSGGGQILKREPHLATVENYKNVAYHLRGTPLEGCKCIIVYDRRVDLKLKYSMDVMRHQTSDWLIDFVLNFGPPKAYYNLRQP